MTIVELARTHVVHLKQFGLFLIFHHQLVDDFHCDVAGVKEGNSRQPLGHEVGHGFSLDADLLDAARFEFQSGRTLVRRFYTFHRDWTGKVVDGENFFETCTQT